MVNIIKIILLYENVKNPEILYESLQQDTKIINVKKEDDINVILAEIEKNNLMNSI